MTSDRKAPPPLLGLGLATCILPLAGTNYKYSIVAPLVPPDWKPDAEVPAWVICEEDDGSETKTAWALETCRKRLAGNALVVEHEDFDADLPKRR